MKFYINYWHLTKFKDLPWENNTEIDDLGMGIKHLTHITEHILERGYNVMVKRMGDDYIIFIDNGNFRQS